MKIKSSSLLLAQLLTLLFAISAAAQTAVGLKTIIAYRGGFDFDQRVRERLDAVHRGERVQNAL